MKKAKRKAGGAPEAEPVGVPIVFVPWPEFEQWTSLAPGSARWVRDSGDRIAGLNFSCPGGCGEVGTCTVIPPGEAKTEESRPSWEWDGDLEKPTLKPSILSKLPHGCGWHGYLRGGVFKAIPGAKNQCQRPKQ